ncbi:MAG: hypothetical protein JNL98_10375 [Bryobacterales bacterium]|nr:hypothetical protein [Bryobacterales bacterium]
MQRRAFIAGAAIHAVCAYADERQDFTDWVGRWVAYLSAENHSSFLRAIDRQMPGRDELETNLVAILRGREVSSSVQIQSFDPEAGEARLDWFLNLAPRTPPGETERRRETVILKLAKQKKGWRVLHLEPLSLFRPPA